MVHKCVERLQRHPLIFVSNIEKFNMTIKVEPNIQLPENHTSKSSSYVPSNSILIINNVFDICQYPYKMNQSNK